jgi:chaperone required for assembly of F1-ATPase
VSPNSNNILSAVVIGTPASLAAKTELKKQATNRLEELKKRVIYSDKSPEIQINELAKAFRVDLEKGILKPGEQLPDVVKKLFSSPEDAIIAGKKIPVTDYRSALIDTITQQSKDIYSTRFFNFVEKI